MTNQIQINELSLAALDVNPAPFAFADGFDDTWEEVAIGLLQCDVCTTTYIDDVYDEGDPCPDKLPDGDAAHYGTLERPEGAPMMNYHYALPHYRGDPEADQLTLYQSSANVVLIMIRGVDGDDDTYTLALSGGGMDLSWDICHAYILLGYTPPLHFCDLPDFAGQDNTQEPFASIIKACLRSVESVVKKAEWKKEKLLTAQSRTGTAE